MDSGIDMASAAEKDKVLDSSQVALDRKEEGIGYTLAHVFVVAVADRVAAAADKVEVVAVAAAVGNEANETEILAAVAAIRPIRHYPSVHD